MPDAGSAGTAFLDIDEVLCIGQPEACLELSRRMSAGDVPSSQALEAVFSPVARNALAVIHRRTGGAVRYVISSSWREHFSREAMALLLHRGGLSFVANADLTNASFPQLKTISGGLLIANNTAFEEVTGFPALTRVGGAVDISGNFTE